MTRPQAWARSTSITCWRRGNLGHGHGGLDDDADGGDHLARFRRGRHDYDYRRFRFQLEHDHTDRHVGHCGRRDYQTSSLALSSGSATYIFSSTSTGSHVITATYSGDSTYASSSGTLTLTVTGKKTFTLGATNLTVSAGSSGTSTITITPANGYTGTIGWTISSSPSLSNGCFSLPSATVSSTSTVTAAMTVYTSSSACSSASVPGTETQSQVLRHSPERLPERTATALSLERSEGLCGPGRTGPARAARMPSPQVAHACRSLPSGGGLLCGIELRWLGCGIVIVNHVIRYEGNLHRNHRRHRHLLVLHHGIDHDDADR